MFFVILFWNKSYEVGFVRKGFPNGRFCTQSTVTPDTDTAQRTLRHSTLPPHPAPRWAPHLLLATTGYVLTRVLIDLNLFCYA